MSKIVRAFMFVTILVSAVGVPRPKRTGYGPGEQEWGWFEVRSEAHMFFWLYYTNAAVSNIYNRPLVIWLQGGPGASSTGIGNFMEIGTLKTNGEPRSHAWTNHVNVLYVDCPVGTGFSYVHDIKQLARNNSQIGRDMVQFLTQFYENFPSFSKTPMYIFSESYGGKISVEIALQLTRAIKAGKLKANFKGVALIDSWISPMDSVVNEVPFLLLTGIIDERGYTKLMGLAKSVKEALKAQNYTLALDRMTILHSSIYNETGGVDMYNILTKVKYEQKGVETVLGRIDGKHKPMSEIDDVSKLMNGPVRKALNISNAIVYDILSDDVVHALFGDFMTPVTQVVEHLLNNTDLHLVVLSGQLDLIVDTYGTLSWVDKLKWKGKSKWESAERKILDIDGYVEGYVTEADNLSFYSVIRSGHMIPKDNPGAALEILRRTTKFDDRLLGEKDCDSS